MPGMSSAIAAIALATMMLATPGLAAAQDITQERDLSVEVLTGSTLKMGGGDWIAVRAGDISYGVIYGTEDNPNAIILLTDQRKFIGGADVYGEDGELLRMQGIPIDLIFAGKLATIVEFRDMDNDSLFDLRWLENKTGLVDKPVKTASLEVPWTLDNLEVVNGTDVTTVTFDLTATNVSYTWVWGNNGMMNIPTKATPADGAVEKITFTIHLTFKEEMKTVQMVPWFNVTIVDNKVANHTFAGYRNYTANVLNGTIKYDQYIEGWDFKNSSNKLAVEMFLISGIHATGPVADRIRERAYHMNCEMNGTQIANGSGSGPVAPVRARDTLRIQNEWENIGNLTWVNDVNVDGVEKQMAFQVQNGGAFSFSSNGHLYLGFIVRAALIYPAGNVIIHDPQIQSSASVLTIGDTANAFSKFVVFGQLIAVMLGLGLALAMGIFLKKQYEKRPPAAVTRQKPLYPPIPQQPPTRPPSPPFRGGKEQ